MLVFYVFPGMFRRAYNQLSHGGPRNKNIGRISSVKKLGVITHMQYFNILDIYTSYLHVYVHTDSMNCTHP
jgi:hypothetical protein